MAITARSQSDVSDHDGFAEVVLRPGAEVESTDRVAMRLTDVVVDPIDNTLSHIVVTPPGKHQSARLVPCWLVRAVGDEIRVELDARHVRQLQRVLPTDFVRMPRGAIETNATIRFRTVLNQPFFHDPRSEPAGASDLGFTRSECPLRCDDDVVSCNDRLLGQIRAFLVREGRVRAMVVGSGLMGFQHQVIVPTEAIAEYLPGMVVLDMDRHSFRKLEVTSMVPPVVRNRSVRERLADRVTAAYFILRDIVVS